MIIETVTIFIKPGMQAGFEAAVGEAIGVFRRAPGWQSLELQRCIEEPERYSVLIGWDTVEDHTEGFRNSPLFQEWRALVGSYFAEPPAVRHYEVAIPLASR